MSLLNIWKNVVVRFWCVTIDILVFILTHLMLFISVALNLLTLCSKYSSQVIPLYNEFVLFASFFISVYHCSRYRSYTLTKKKDHEWTRGFTSIIRSNFCVWITTTMFLYKIWLSWGKCYLITRKTSSG